MSRSAGKCRKLSIYIHIPFCKSKCYYCDFISYASKENIVEEYIKYLKVELAEVAEGIKLDKKEVAIKTIYIGGGTPSYINSNYIVEIIKQIKEQYNVNEDTEITLEVNPGTVDESKLQKYFNVGINRLSIGLQSTDNERLKQIGRIHTYEEFIKTYETAQKVGFNNINIDIIIGLPNQKAEEIKQSIKGIIKLEPKHISIYSLIIEEGTKIEKMLENREIELPEESEERQMYWEIKQALEKEGYFHYEISNFAKKGYESKHNIDCWKQKEYIGFGASAHSYTEGVRYSNLESIEEYIQNFKENKQEDNIIIHEKQDKTAMAKEYIILALRMLEGISIDNFYEKFEYDILKGFAKEFEKLQNQELIKIENGYIALTNKGIDLANLVWEEFI